MDSVHRHSKSTYILERALQTAKNWCFRKITLCSLMPITADAFLLILKANPSEKFMVENI